MLHSLKCEVGRMEDGMKLYVMLCSEGIATQHPIYGPWRHIFLFLLQNLADQLGVLDTKVVAHVPQLHDHPFSQVQRHERRPA
jgi:hypothetical protein